MHINAEGNLFSVADNGRGDAVDRGVVGAPFLQFIYTQLGCPLDAVKGSPVQLPGIGMSLLNLLCCALLVTILKSYKTPRQTYLRRT